MKKLQRRTILKGIAAAPILLAHRGSWAATGAPTMPSEIDVAKAKAEGKLTLYTSLDTKIVDLIIGPFKAKYGIAVEYFRGGSADVTSKVLAEADAGRIQADMVDASDLAALLVMKEKGLLLPKQSDATSAIAANLRDADGTWMADRLTQGVIQYNVTEFGGEKAPKTWKDLTSPAMKGRLAFFSSANGDGAPRLYTLAKHLGWELLEALAANKPIRVPTPQLVTQLLESGERGAAFATNDNIAWRSKLDGKPTGYINPPEGVPTEPGAVGLIKGSAHPHAAFLFHEFWMGKDAQALLVKGGKYSSRSDVAPPTGSPPLNSLKLLTLDYAEYKKDRQAILRRMTDVFGGEWGNLAWRSSFPPPGPRRHSVTPRLHTSLRHSGRWDGSTIVFCFSIGLLLVIVGYPLLWLLMSAFGIPGEFQLGYIAGVYSRSQNLAPLINTLVLALGAAIISVALGVPLAWTTARSDVPLRRTIQALVAVAYITPPYLTAIAYIILLGPDAGYFNRALQGLTGATRGPFDIFSMGGVIFVIGMHVFPFTYFMTHNALRSVDVSYEEAARLLGARRWSVLLRVNLPLVAPAITGGALLSAIDSMALFGPQAFLGLPAQITFLPTRIYGIIGSYPPRWAEASALSLTLVLLTVCGLILQRGYLAGRSHTTVGGRGLRLETVRLGWWKWPLLAFSFVVVFLSALAPVGVLAIAAFSRNWINGISAANLTLTNFGEALFNNQIAVRGILNSFQLATAAGLCAVVVGATVAYVDLRTQVKGRRLLDYLAILPLGLPGTVMAVGVLLAFIRPPFAIYGTMWILLVAYVARFVPLATRSANATLRQIDPSLEEAARITGASRLAALWRILLPLTRPGMAVAFLLVFIPALSELSATILLYSGGTETIAVAIFRLNDLGQIEVVAALAVFTIAVTLLVSLPLNWFSNRSRIVPAGAASRSGS